MVHTHRRLQHNAKAKLRMQKSRQKTYPRVCELCHTIVPWNMAKHLQRKHGHKPPVPNVGGPYRFIAKMVRTLITCDVRCKRACSKILSKENIRAITMEIIHQLTQNNQIDNQMDSIKCYDQWGGYLQNGFSMHSHSLYKLSLDRLDNEKAHFVYDGKSWTKNTRFLILGMNHQTNPANISIDVMRDRMCMSDNTEQQLIERLQHVPLYKTIPYRSITCAREKRRKDPCRSVWPNIKDHVAYELKMLKQQHFRCAISGMVMSDTIDRESNNRPFAPSLDAIDPVKGHIPGNTRWICSFLNSSNNDKRKKGCFEDDSPTIWNTELWKEYLYGDAYIKFREYINCKNT